MSQSSSRLKTRWFVLGGLGIALLIAVCVSPLASHNPDGLDRVAQDYQFDRQATEAAPAQKLPFYQVFEEYAMRGVPEAVATPLAGLAGTVLTFALAWGIGKLATRNADRSSDSQDL